MRERTKTKKTTSTPVWNSNYFFYIPPEQGNSAFDVDLYDWSLLGIFLSFLPFPCHLLKQLLLNLGTSHFMGDTSIPLQDLIVDSLQDIWLVSDLCHLLRNDTKQAITLMFSCW